jgi:hypothetical protein
MGSVAVTVGHAKKENWSTNPGDHHNLRVMKPKPRSLDQKVFVAGLVAGLAAGWSGGCSKSNSTNVNLEQARAALSKRRSDYGEIPPTESRASEKARVQHR